MKRVSMFLFGSFIVLTILWVFMPTSILMGDDITPLQYLSSIPYITINLFGRELIIIKPSSTIIVFLLGFQIVYLGYSFLKYRQDERQFWWGISMIAWGIGTLLAGMSYQGLGYELKCRPYDLCIFTSWFELAYLYVTAISMSALAIAISRTVLDKDKRKFLENYALYALIIYTLLLVLGSIIESWFLISYELFTIFYMPMFIIFFGYSLIGYFKKKDSLNQTLIVLWLLFLIVNVMYYVTYFAGMTEFIYSNFNIWFSSNDVLHVLLILWMLFIQIKVKRVIQNEEN